MLVLFFTFVTAGKKILVPRENTHFVSFLEHEHFAREHNLELLSAAGPTFITDDDNYNVFSNTIEQMYHVEDDVIISLDSADNQFVLVNEPSPKSDYAWHLDAIVRSGPEDPTVFSYTEPGSCHTDSNVHVKTYVVDTGIDVSHSQFGGRATWANNFAGDGVDRDCQSHGTHVAGTIGSKNYGVCVDAELYAVKVLDCEGRGALSGVIRGIDWVFGVHKSEKEELRRNDSDKVLKSVINMSLGGGFSRALNRVVQHAINDDSDFYIVVAAGNENDDACESSPASVRSAFTAMASDKHFNRAWFSNWGDCANLYAPGVDVLSTVPNERTAVMSGTSFSSPITAGVFNHYLHMYPSLDMKGIKNQIIKDSSKDVVRSYKPGGRDHVYLKR